MTNIVRNFKIKQSDGTMSDPIRFGAVAADVSIGNSDVATELNKKLDATNIIQGDNIVLSKSGNNITISATGGGESGSLPIYENVASMIADTSLTEGSTVMTLGYYSINDGGGAQYYIVNSTDNYAETLENGKKAELIVEDDAINILQVGAKGDNTFDNTNIFKSLIYANKNNKKIIIPSGIYKTNSWGTAGANQRNTNIELIGINKPTINLIPSSTATLQGTYSGDFSVNPGYAKITTGSSFTIATKELADGQKYYYLQCADKTLIPDGLNSTCYLVGETSGIRYAVASVDSDNPDGTGTARIYLYDIEAGKKPSIIYNNSSDTLSENLWVSKYNNNGIWYIDFGSTTTPDYFKTTNRHISQESTSKHARTKAVFTYDSKDFIVIDCFTDEYYNSPFSSIVPLDNNTELKVYSNTNVSGSLCSLNRYQNVIIDNIKFNGNNYTIGNYQTSYNDWNLIYFGGTKNITIKNCIFGNAIMAGIQVGGAGNAYAEVIHDYPENVLIDNCYFYNNGRNDLEIIHGKNITITNRNGLGTLDIEANSAEILDNVHISNCNFNSTTPYRPAATTNFSNINYSDCSFVSILCQRGTRINLSNVKCHAISPYAETVIKGVNCLINKITQTYGNEHLHFVNTTFLGLTNGQPGSSYGNSKWYFDNCCIDLSLVRTFALYNNKMFYLRSSVLTADEAITGTDIQSIMHFTNSEIHNIKINASNNVDRNIFDGCIFTSSTGHHSFGQNVMSGIFKNCYIKTNITSTYGRMTFLDCILGNTQQPVIGATSRGSYINGIKTDDASQDINWNWVYGGGESKLIFKNVYYDVTTSDLGIIAGTAAISSSTVSDESYYLYGNNSSNYIKGAVVYDNTTVTIQKIAAGGGGGGSAVKVFYNTIAEMKADTELAAGDIVATIGYYSANDGAAAKYKIVNDSNLVDNGGSVHTLTNGLKATLIVEGNDVLVDLWGTQKVSTAMDTTKIQGAIDYAVTNNKNIVFSHADYYIDDQLTINNITLDKDVHIIGNGANILLKNDEEGFKAFYIKAKSCLIENLTIDGTNTTQDQFAITDNTQLKLYTAFDILTDKIELKDLNILNIYGNAFIFYNYSKISAKNIIIDNVGGHWYQNNEYDAFGDAFYFGAHDGRADIYLENIKATGKSKNTTLSRIGIVIENLNQQLTDTITNIDMISCYLYNYDRIIHAEAIQGNAIINWHVGEATGNVFGFNYNTNVSQLVINADEITMNFTAQNYNGACGQYKCQFNYNNCTINTGTQSLGMFSATGKYLECKINGITTTQFNGAGSIVLEKCNIQYNGISTYLIYNSNNILFDKCTLSSNSVVTMNGDGSAEQFKSCVFNNIYPGTVKPKFLDLNSEIHTASGFSLSDDTKRNMRMTTVYDNNGKIILQPHISQTFPMLDVLQEKAYGRRTIPADSTLALMPTFDGIITRPNNKYILITMGASGWTTQYTGRQFVSFYYNIITTNASNVMTVGPTKTFGTVPANYVLTINDTNKTIARSGQYTDTCNQWFLPYNYVEYIDGFEQTKQVVVTYTDDTTETINVVVSN